ncbi:TPA: GPO family capsid scaffolding protein, partial [Escherichia coli]
SKTRTADGEQFSQLRDVVENIASDHADLIDRFSTLEQKHALDKTALDELSHELVALKAQLRNQDADPQQRFASAGGTDQTLAEF